MEWDEVIKTLLIPAFVGGGVASLQCWQANKQLKAKLRSQESKLYKELITSEHIKTYNSLRDSMIDALNLSLKLTYNVLFDGKSKEEKHALAEEYKQFSTDFHAKIMRMKLTVKPNEFDFLQKVEKYKQTVNEFIEKILTASEGDTIEVSIDKPNHFFEEQCQIFLKQEWERIQKEAGELYNIGK